ncbi:hypothetical protein BJX66DRAFT_313826 [Aspergillus keveii]|uniref:F-box domain-containing protein n=1 Tax=Aspergillus keveii TaxID=714993 RepID=A0ABR4FRR8_9EURO
MGLRRILRLPLIPSSIPSLCNNTMPLLDLPLEVLLLLPSYLDNIESFKNAASSCRTFRNVFAKTLPSTILRLAAASAPTFFSPHPHFLVAASVRSVSDWALGHEDRTKLLRDAFRSGIYSLYNFCLEHGGLTLDRIRETHLARFTTINPLSDKIDKMAGEQWMSTPDFWDGGVSEPNTLYTDADRAALQIIIYGELFGRSMEAFLNPAERVASFDIITRQEYFMYCLPDDESPYDPDGAMQFSYYEDQRTLRHILKSGRWRRMWAAAIREFLDPEFSDEEAADEDWRKKMLRDALLLQGIAGFQLIACKPGDVPEEAVTKARQVRHRILALKEPPQSQTFGKQGTSRVSEAPDPQNEVNVSYRRQWY